MAIPKQHMEWCQQMVAQNSTLSVGKICDLINGDGRLTTQLKPHDIYNLKNKIKPKKIKSPISSDSLPDADIVTFDGLVKQILQLAEYAKQLRKAQLERAEKLFL